MMNRLILCGLLAPALALSCAGVAEPAPECLPVLAGADTTACDDLGRRLPDDHEVGGPKSNRWVGLFYWQWHRELSGWTSFNITEWLKANPGFRDFTAHPEGGPSNPQWYWAEPLFGYYKSADPWVIRKHLVMLSDAGVDFLFLDYTNASIYEPELKVFLEVAGELKAKGLAVPRLVFFLNHEPEWKIEAIYTRWYKPGAHDSSWFRWQGKPLIMAPRPADPKKLKNPALLKEIQDYFTWRPTWAFHDAGKEPTMWRFIEVLPQRPAKGPDGRIEQMTVCKSTGGPLWDVMPKGGVSQRPGYVPVYDAQWLTPDSGKGYFFAEQWKHVEKAGAPILLVTGWNEWTAAVWETPGVVFLGRKTQKGQGHIVDQFNMEFNRDLEPMKEGCRDNYYMQFLAEMRRYKGMSPPQPVSAPLTAVIDGKWDEWREVTPLYRDTQADIADRDCPATVKDVYYYSRSARNDLVAAQVTRDASNVYFHVRTAVAIKPASDTGRMDDSSGVLGWMNLLIDADANPATGWNGYDYIVNRCRSGNRCRVERNVGGSWQWEKVAEVPIAWNGSDLELSIPRPVLGGAFLKGPLKFDFKWTDNVLDAPDVMDFYLEGDVAPNGRLNYRYRE